MQNDRVKRWTPGAWSASGYLVYGDVSNVPKTVAVTRLERWKSKLPIDESQANAFLMASSPDLVEALELFSTQHKCGCGHPACNRCADDKIADEALAKAYGEQ